MRRAWPPGRMSGVGGGSGAALAWTGAGKNKNTGYSEPNPMPSFSCIKKRACYSISWLSGPNEPGQFSNAGPALWNVGAVSGARPRQFPSLEGHRSTSRAWTVVRSHQMPVREASMKNDDSPCPSMPGRAGSLITLSTTQENTRRSASHIVPAGPRHYTAESANGVANQAIDPHPN